MIKTILCLSIAAALTAHAQTITWGTPTTVAGSNDVILAGTYFGSWAPGNDTAASGEPVNGETFQPTSDLPDFSVNIINGGTYGGFDSPGTADPDYNAVLQFGDYLQSGSSFQWDGLTPGGLYLVQFWVNDSRNTFNPGSINPNPRFEALSGGPIGNVASNVDNSSLLEYAGNANAGGIPAQFIYGTFTADSAGSEEILITTTLGASGGGSGQVNLFQVRSLPLAAEAWNTPTVSPSTTVFAGTALTISEPLLTGLPPFTYQWQANGVNINGATNSVLTITATNTSQSVPVVVNYGLVVANASGTNTSPAVGVTINPAAAPGVATNVPAPPTLFSGDTVTLSFAVSGTPPLWVEWERNGSPIGTFTNIGEALTASLTLTALQASQGGIYSVIVTNEFGAINSATNGQNYSLTVEPYPQFTWFAPQPITTADAVLELFGGATNPAVVFEATAFGGDNAPGTAVTLDDGQVITFEQVAAQPFSPPSGVAPGQVATGNGTCFQGDFGTYTGTTSNADFDNVLNGTDDGVMANLSSMTFSNLTPGTLYGLQIFAIDDRAGNGAPDLIDFQDPNDTNSVSASYLLGANNYSLGMFVANGTTQTVNMELPGLTAGGDILDAAVLYSLPLAAEPWDPLTVSPSTNVFAGTVLTISEPLLTGLPPFTYQWQANGVNITGATNSVLTITATNASHSQVVVNYGLVVANSSGTNTSPAVGVTINPLVPLSVKLASGSVTISWPVSAGGSSVLQTTASLTQPWTTVQPPYPVVGSQYQVTVSATGTAFFRLGSPQ